MHGSEEYWFRYDDYLVSLDEETTEVRIRLRKMRVVRYTPQGAWLEDVFNPMTGRHDTRLVLRTSRKRYACPTEAEAMTSFIARKKRQLSILDYQARNVRKALMLVNAELDLFQQDPTDVRSCERPIPAAALDLG